MDREQLIIDFGQHFRKVTKMARMEFIEILDQYIPFNEFLVLKVLFQAEGFKLRVSQIAEKLEVSNSHVTAASEKLVKKGFILRERSEQDRRIVYLTLTENGIKLVEEMEKIIQQYFRKKLQGLSDDEIEIGIQIFKKILA